MPRFLSPSVLLIAFALGVSACSRADSSAAAAPPFTRIDAHAHVFAVAPELISMLERQHMRFMTICVVDKHDIGFEEAAFQNATGPQITAASRGMATWCATFDPLHWEDPGFADRVIKDLDKSFVDGAIAVKIYKTIGMELRSKSGEFLLPDNPVFSPILEHIAAQNKTLFAHIAEPTEAWQPLDPKSSSYSYFKENPVYHMYQHPGSPSKEAILAARDHLLAMHPKLRVVGCHLGSMEDDVDQIAHCLDKYPNFAVDTAARVRYLMAQPREKVRAFFLKYPDRVLYGTDLSCLPRDRPKDEKELKDWEIHTAKKWETTYALDWKYFATDEKIETAKLKTQGLKLPEPILRKLYHDNAVKWVPGIES